MTRVSSGRLKMHDVGTLYFMGTSYTVAHNFTACLDSLPLLNIQYEYNNNIKSRYW